MSQNIFEELQGKKQKLLSLARKAADFGWIPEHKSPSANPTGNKGSEAISYDEIVEKLEKDTLTIGVIGQMKCGKSTFLNSFVFENDILPAATTPMTAALSSHTARKKELLLNFTPPTNGRSKKCKHQGLWMKPTMRWKNQK